MNVEAMNTQPEALRLANELDAVPEKGADPDVIQEAAAELRRLHAENTDLRAAIQQAEETRHKLSCGCPSQYGGIPAEWATTDREGNPAIAYGVICEKHWHEYDAQHPKVWQEPGQVEFDYRHPQARALIANAERNLMCIDLIWRILKDPHQYFTASDMENWDEIHDAVRAALIKLD
jgi:hypothetical protein